VKSITLKKMTVDETPVSPPVADPTTTQSTLAKKQAQTDQVKHKEFTLIDF
jgi:hypothetical protein